MYLYLLCVVTCIRKNTFTVKVVQQQLEEVVQRSCGVFIFIDIQNSSAHGSEPTVLVVGVD